MSPSACNQKSEIRKLLFNNITIECMQLASYSDIHMKQNGLVSLPLKDNKADGTLKYIHQHLVNNNFNSSVSNKVSYITT